MVDRGNSLITGALSMKTVRITMTPTSGWAMKVATLQRHQKPAEATTIDQLDSAQLDATITIALFRNERRILLIAIAVVLAMMAAIIAL